MAGKQKYWIGFNLVKGIGPVRIRRLLNYFGDIETAWNASQNSLQAAGLSLALQTRLIERRSKLDLDQVWQDIQGKGMTVLTWDDPKYPSSLKTIHQPPPVLYLDGDLQEADEPSVAIVGTRRPTTYGRRLAQDLSTTLARAGITVVSGLARGIDSEAHREALRAGGRTIAVLGSGLDKIYPPENQRLSENIRNNGALLSDYPLGTPPEAVNFPPRNRIISGLAQAVVVLEAGSRSGAMITATFAAEQGKEVFVAPGPIYSSQSKGTNSLIQQGAHPLLDSSELLDFLNIQKVYDRAATRNKIQMDPVEEKILALVRDETLHVDDICLQSEMPIEELTAILTIMELKGLIRVESGKRYIAIHERSPEYSLAYYA